MKKTIFFLIYLIIITSCNLPARKATPSINELSTFVAQTLTAKPKGGRSTVVPAQPEVINIPTPTQTITASLTPSLTPTFTTTPTNIPEDPKTGLGAPTWQDTLDKGTAFFKDKPWLYEDDYNRISIENGKMTLSSLGTGIGFRGWRLAPRKPQNFYLEATFSSPGCSGSDLYGLLFRAADYTSGKGYYYGITCDGRYSLTKIDNDGTSTIINPTNNSKFLAGANQSNRIGVMLVNDTFRLYANGSFIEERKDSSITEGGYIGPFFAGQTGGFTVTMDEIAYWLLP